MGAFWLKNGKLLAVGSTLIDCGECPCDEEPVQDCGLCAPGTTPESLVVEFGGVAADGHCADYYLWNTTSIVASLSPDYPCLYLGYLEVCGSTFEVAVQQPFLGNTMTVVMMNLANGEFANGFEQYEGDTTNCVEFSFAMQNLFPQTEPYGDWSGASCVVRNL
jgi:hypothetical protein